MHNTELRIHYTEYFPLHTSHMNNRKSERESGESTYPILYMHIIQCFQTKLRIVCSCKISPQNNIKNSN